MIQHAPETRTHTHRLGHQAGMACHMSQSRFLCGEEPPPASKWGRAEGRSGGAGVRCERAGRRGRGRSAWSAGVDVDSGGDPGDGGHGRLYAPSAGSREIRATPASPAGPRVGEVS